MSPDRGRVCLAALFGLTLLGGAPFAAPSPSASDIVMPGLRKAAPPLALRDASGKTHPLSALKGHVVILDFWATWCTGCKLEIPWFMEFEKQYRDNALSAIGIAVDEEGWRTVKTYMAEHPITYPVVLGNFDVLAKTFKLPASLPATLLIDRDGRIAARHTGVVDKEKFDLQIRQLLHEKPARK